MTRFALGVDAGGTRTRWVVVDDSGAPVATGAAPGSNPNSTRDAADALGIALREVADTVGTAGIESAVFAVAGAGPAGRAAVEDAVHGAARRAGLDFGALTVCSDCEAAFAAGSTTPDGTVLISGTGAVTAQLRNFTVVRRRDGHGYLLGDAGSALSIAVAGVRAVLAELEGAGPATALRGPLLDWARRDPAVLQRPAAADLDDVQAILAATYAHPPAHLAAVAQLVDEAASAGDATAGRIAAGAVAALVESVAVVRPDPGNSTPLVVTGGVATGTGALGCSLRAALESRFGVRPRVVVDGRIGAAALALRQLPGGGAPIADHLVHQAGS